MRKIFSQNIEDDESNIDITPMLDVVFIMLIFFIVTATFVKEAGIEVNRPDTTDQPPPDSDNKNILVRIDATDLIWIENRQVDQRAVQPNIERLHAENPEGMVVILSHKESTTDVLIQVMDASRSAGIYNVAIAEQEG